ncbi:MAG: NADPH:quinone reductase [Chloroflexi bacterium]|nr:MAG: NADPH:quinone reductase [Chloroflexota bacterium]
MKTIVYERYGNPDVLQIKDLETPVIKSNEVLIKVRACSVNPIDWKIRKGFLPGRLLLGLFKPRMRILGFDMAGIVESIGKDVSLFSDGDEVFCGTMGGSYAEYVAIPETAAITLKPANMTFEEAAAVPLAAVTALQALRNKANIRNGHQVLVHGASGGVGTFGVQIAKALGGEVTGVTSTHNLELVASLGATKVIDYTKEDFATNDQTYDIVFDAVGKSSFYHYKSSLTQNGVYVTATPRISDAIPIICTSMGTGKKSKTLLTNANSDDLIFIRDLVETGQLRSIIDKRYEYNQIVQAHQYAEKEHSKGKVIIAF